MGSQALFIRLTWRNVYLLSHTVRMTNTRHTGRNSAVPSLIDPLTDPLTDNVMLLVGTRAASDIPVECLFILKSPIGGDCGLATVGELPFRALVSASLIIFGNGCSAKDAISLLRICAVLRSLSLTKQHWNSGGMSGNLSVPAESE